MNKQVILLIPRLVTGKLQEDDNGTWDFLSKCPRLSKTHYHNSFCNLLIFSLQFTSNQTHRKMKSENGNSKNLKREQKGSSQDDRRTDPRNPFLPDGENLGYRKQLLLKPSRVFAVRFY